MTQKEISRLVGVMPDGTRQWRADFSERALAVQSAAAPDLLAALEQSLVAMTTTRIVSGGTSPYMADAIEAARAAIAKAQGNEVKS